MKHNIDDIHTSPLGRLVVIRHRDEIDPGSDEFLTKEGEKRRLSAGIGRTVVQALPDHVGVCEVVRVGPDVKRVKEGDVCLIDFYETKQPYMLDGENYFIADSEALRCFVDPVNCKVTPMKEYVMTKHSPDRMSLAFFGIRDSVLPRDKTTSGIPGRKVWSHKLKAEVDCFFVTYEEVVALGYDCIGKGIEIGDLVVIVTDFAMKFRAEGESMRLTEIGLGCLATIDDAAIEEDVMEREKTREAVACILNPTNRLVLT